MLDTTPIKTEGLNVYSGKGTIFYATRNERNYTISSKVINNFLYKIFLSAFKSYRN